MAGSARRRLTVLVLHAEAADNATLSYQRGWPRHLREHPALEARLVNVLEGTAVRRLLIGLRFGRRRYDAAILLHSTCSNAIQVPERLVDALGRASFPVVLFLGNEYKLMPEKLALAERLRVALLVSQLESEPALDLYRARLGCTVIGLPNTGLDPELFRPGPAPAERGIDLGYRAYDSPLYLGHAERREIADTFAEAGARRGLALDISLDPGARFTEPEWARFLAGCRGQLGTEAGGDYFELDDRTRIAVNAYLDDHPAAGIAEIRARFFDGYEHPVPGRALSGRIVEAAGTKTVQLLLDGEYGGWFRPDEHYIPVRKDFSNVDEALDKLADQAVCHDLTEAAYAVVTEQLTYTRLVDRLLDALDPLVQ